jgi:hypothetical protein
MDSRARARFAAATGLLFAATIVATGIISEVKEFDRAGDLVLQSSNEVFGTVSLLTGFAAAFFFAFGSTLAARIRQLEGGSGRLAAAVNGSGAIIAGVLAVSVGIGYAARSTGSADLAALLTGLLDGPTLFFPAAVFLGSGSLVALRTPSIPGYSMWSARLIFPLSLAYLAMAGLQLFKNYAWINETGYISFVVTIAIVSLIGINRWGEMDGTTPAQRRAPAAPVAAPAAPAAAKRKPAKRKPARKR